ncbi:MAG: SGNH/GDSL hydrolase family protein [Acidobacteria bacterium]|nr:SGNH/GDSL hydrolase family protein [Acidobacteriota bacterium]
MRHPRPVFLLPAVLAMALFLTPRDIAFHGGSIAFIGNSVTVGASASDPSKSFASLLTAFLDERHPEKRRIFISVDPARDLGAASEAMRDDREFVIIELGVHAVVDPNISADDFRQLYASILDCVTGGDTIVVAGTIPWLAWAAVDPLYERADLFSRIIAEEAAKRQVAVADLWSATKLRLNLISTPQDRTFLSDGRGDNFHPNDAGHAVIAKTYEEAIVAALANPPNRPFDRQCR